MSKNNYSLERRVFGGLNFIIVFWALLTMLRLVTVLDNDIVETLKDTQLYVYILPMLFLVVINMLIGITLFFPQKENSLWFLSLLIVMVTLIALNTFHLKLQNVKGANAYQQESIYDF